MSALLLLADAAALAAYDHLMDRMAQTGRD